MASGPMSPFEAANILSYVVVRLAEEWISTSVVVRDPMAIAPSARYDFSRHRAELDDAIERAFRHRVNAPRRDQIEWALAGILEVIKIELPEGPVSLARCLR